MANFFKYVLKESQDLDLKQKVIFYYRLLQKDLNLAKTIITRESDEMGSNIFYEDMQCEKRERLFLEFNSLSVVYGKPSETFLRDQALK